MGERKTVYEVSWHPSLVSVIVFLASVATLMYTPHWVQVPIFFSSFFALPLVLIAAAGIVGFFYHGLERANQAKIFFFFLTIYSLLGITANIFYQSTFLLSPRVLATDGFITGLLNACAIAVTLSCYRLKGVKVDADTLISSQPTKAWWLKISPAALTAAVALSAVWLMWTWKSFMTSESFAVNIPYFIGLQIFANVGGTFYFFRSKTRAQKLRLSFVVIAIATALGTLSNLVHRHTTLRPGDKLELQSVDFLIMNVGAMVIVLTYELWKRHLQAEKEKWAAKDSLPTPAKPERTASAPQAEQPTPDNAPPTITATEANKSNQPTDAETKSSKKSSGEKSSKDEEITTPTAESKPVEAEQGINK